MPAMLSGSVRSVIIQQWLQGKSRNAIAAENGISSGAVTNIVNDWRRNLGHVDANELRDLAIILKKLNVTAPQCANGLRIASIMQRLGIAEDCFEAFILDVYNRCKNIELSPEKISFLLQDLVEFSKNVLPLSKISPYIKGKVDEKMKLEEELKKLTRQIAELKQEKDNHEFLRDQALQQKEITIFDLDRYSNLRSELKKHSIPIDDASRFARLIRNIEQESNYDVSKVITQYSDLELRRRNREMLESNLYTLRNSVSQLEQERSVLEAFVNLHRKTMSTYNQLESMEFGLKELNFLYDTIGEIALENNFPVGNATQKFLSDVENQYHRKVGFEDKVQELKIELNILRKERAEIRTEMLLNPLIGPKIMKLNLNELSNKTIMNILTLFEKYGADGEDNTDGQALLSDLNKYSGIKSALKAFTTEVEALKRDAALLVVQKQSLEEGNKMILSSYTRLVRVVYFLEGTAISLRREILSLALIYAFSWYMPKAQIQDDNNGINENKQRPPYQLDEFAALSRAIKGEDVSMKELKAAVLKSIQALLNRIAPDEDLLAGGLLAAYDALIEQDV